MTVGVIATEFDEKAYAGLPGPLPAGEHIVWQGRPAARAIARDKLKTRWIGGYFALMLVWLLATGFYFERAAVDVAISLMIMALAGGVVLGLARWFAWGVHKTSLYTITTRRVVMRFGIALPKAFNLPFAQIESVDVRADKNGNGDIALRFKPDIRLNWFIFWPHVRGLRMGRMEPQMIGIEDVADVADRLSTQLHAHFARNHRVEQPATAADDDSPMVPFPQAAE